KVRARWAYFLKENGQFREAEKVFREVLEVRKALAAEFPRKTSSWHNLAVLYGDFGNLLSETDRLKESVQAQRDSLASWEKMEAPSPGSVPRDQLARTHLNLGAVLGASGQLREAEEQSGQALEIRKRLVEDFPTVPGYQYRLAMTYYNLAGNLRGNHARHPEAEKCLCQARDLQRRLVKDFPDEPDYHAALGSTLNNLATLMKGRGQLAESRPVLEEAIAQQQAALKIKPQHPVFRQDLRMHYMNLGDTLVRMGEHAAALRLYGDTFARLPELADDLQFQPRYNAACVAALVGCGQGKNADHTDAKERARLRHQALEGLRADLAAYRRLLDKQPDKPHRGVAERMQHWQQDKDFAGVRGD